MEVCVDSISSALNAEKGGASRLELCSALSEGGLTPSPGILGLLKTKVSIPVFVMIRPRRGNDFVYLDDELKVMSKDIQVLKENGADGFVFGVLTADFCVDVDACSQLMKVVGNSVPVTFHRAFDMVSDPFKALETLVGLGFKRILTSGQRESAESGADTIRDLIQAAQGRITVVPGAGINENNIRMILEKTGAKEFHGSAKKSLPLSLGRPEWASKTESTLAITDKDVVREMVKIYEENKRIG